MTENTPARGQQPERRRVAPLIEVVESDDQYRVLAEVPGADENSVEVTWHEGTLRIHAVAEPLQPEGLQLVHSEFEACVYERVLSLPDDVDVERVEATVRDGLLTVVLPRRRQTQSRRITVKAG